MPNMMTKLAKQEDEQILSDSDRERLAIVFAAALLRDISAAWLPMPEEFRAELEAAAVSGAHLGIEQLRR
jgi:hypothetical protein